MWLDRAIKWLLPRDERFFDLLERGAAAAQQSARQFLAFSEAKDSASRLAVLEQIRMTEQDADQITIEVFDSLHRTFVTPIDRGDIHHLAARLEDVTDRIFETAYQVVVHAIDELPIGNQAFAQLIARACEELNEAAPMLRKLNNPSLLRRRCKNVTSIASQGSELFRQHTADMFRQEVNAIHLLKNKEYLEGLEGILYACKQVAHSLENIVIKNA